MAFCAALVTPLLESLTAHQHRIHYSKPDHTQPAAFSPAAPTRKFPSPQSLETAARPAARSFRCPDKAMSGNRRPICSHTESTPDQSQAFHMFPSPCGDDMPESEKYSIPHNARSRAEPYGPRRIAPAPPPEHRRELEIDRKS